MRWFALTLVLSLACSAALAQPHPLSPPPSHDQSGPTSGGTGAGAPAPHPHPSPYPHPTLLPHPQPTGPPRPKPPREGGDPNQHMCQCEADDPHRPPQGAPLSDQVRVTVLQPLHVVLNTTWIDSFMTRMSRILNKACFFVKARTPNHPVRSPSGKRVPRYLATYVFFYARDNITSASGNQSTALQAGTVTTSTLTQNFTDTQLSSTLGVTVLSVTTASSDNNDVDDTSATSLVVIIGIVVGVVLVAILVLVIGLMVTGKKSLKRRASLDATALEMGLQPSELDSSNNDIIEMTSMHGTVTAAVLASTTHYMTKRARLDNDINVDTELCGISIESDDDSEQHIDARGRTELHKVCYSGDATALAHLLRRSSATSAVTPMSTVDGGSNASSPDATVPSSASISVSPSNLDAVDCAGNTPLLAALSKGHLDCALLLLSQTQRSVNVANRTRDSPLHMVLSAGRRSTQICAVVDKLIGYGADVNATNSAGSTPLHIAAAYGIVESVGLLKEAGIDLDALDNDSSSALLVALKLGFYDCFTALIQAGASTCLPDNNQWTPLHWCCALDHAAGIMEVADAARGKTPALDINALNQQQQTALLLAARENNADAVRNMLDLGASRTLVDREGRTPLDLAKQLGHVQCIDLLQQPSTSGRGRARRATRRQMHGRNSDECVTDSSQEEDLSRTRSTTAARATRTTAPPSTYSAVAVAPPPPTVIRGTSETPSHSSSLTASEATTRVHNLSVPSPATNLSSSPLLDSATLDDRLSEQSFASCEEALLLENVIDKSRTDVISAMDDCDFSDFIKSFPVDGDSFVL